MSVINQMLKDLDERQEQASTSAPEGYVPVQKKTNHLSVILLTVVVTLAIVASIYFFFENQRLKQDSLSEMPSLHAKQQNTQSIAKATDNTANQISSAGIETVNEKGTIGKLAEQRLEQEPAQHQQSVVPNAPVNHESQMISQISDDGQGKELASIKKPAGDKSSVKPAKLAVQQPQFESSSVTIKQEPTVDNTEQIKPIAEQAVKSSAPQEIIKEKPILSISRKQLTPKQLVVKKMQQAEQAILEKDIEGAEKLLEDILFLQPEHKPARKQLAALWFGRKATQPALNLLAQGISLDKNDGEFRMMQAKILLELNQYQAAFNALSPLQQANNVEYQFLLATVAQQVNNEKVALESYQRLIALQPYQGRWHLGLAIAQDKQENYKAASASYHQATQLGGLSESALNFARQRLQELGE